MGRSGRVLRIHIVQKGEGIDQIAAQHKLTIEELAKVNPQLSNLNQVLPGMKLGIPSKIVSVSKLEAKEKTEQTSVNEKALKDHRLTTRNETTYFPASGGYMHCSRCHQLMMVEKPIYLSSQNEPPHAMTRQKWF